MMSFLERWLRTVWQTPEPSVLEADQTVADTDQTSSDADQSLADRDQAAAAADQRASDRDQAIADRDFRASDPVPTAPELRDYELGQNERGKGTMTREATATARMLIAEERDVQAERRDENARHRDHLAEEHDLVAEIADQEAEVLAKDAGEADPRSQAALQAAATARAKAAAARATAAQSREHAARDREAAARDREALRNEIERSQLDELTGAYLKGAGEILLRFEVERAFRLQGNLTLVFIDVDELGETNHRLGYEIGDMLLRNVSIALQARLRPYDPIVRWGGDEFVCTMGGMAPEEVRKRIERVQADLAKLDPSPTLSVGFAALEAGDTLMALVDRADQALRDTRDMESSADEAG